MTDSALALESSLGMETSTFSFSFRSGGSGDLLSGDGEREAEGEWEGLGEWLSSSSREEGRDLSERMSPEAVESVSSVLGGTWGYVVE